MGLSRETMPNGISIYEKKEARQKEVWSGGKYVSKHQCAHPATPM
jgi:hypothetical protein